MKPSQQAIIDYYNTHESRWGYQLVLHGIKHFGFYPAGQENISMSKAILNMMDQVGQRLDLQPGSRILDAGCGEGGTAIHLARTRGYKVEGVDILDFNIDRAKQQAEELKATANFSLASYDQLPFADQTFDGLYTLETLVHSADAAATLKEFKRVLKPHGKLVLVEYSVPKTNDMNKRQHRILKYIADGSAMHSLLSFTHGSFPERLTKAGFANIKVENASKRIAPMIRRFHRMGFIPYQFIRLLGLQKRFVNTTSGVELNRYRQIFRYNFITATKP